MDANEILKETEIMCESGKSQNEIITFFIQENLKIDDALKQAYDERKITTDGIYQYIKEQAQKSMKNGISAIWHTQVFNWILHYIQDVPTEELYETKKAKQKETTIAKPTTISKSKNDHFCGTKNNDEISLFNDENETTEDSEYNLFTDEKPIQTKNKKTKKGVDENQPSLFDFEF